MQGVGLVDCALWQPCAIIIVGVVDGRTYEVIVAFTQQKPQVLCCTHEAIEASAPVARYALIFTQLCR